MPWQSACKPPPWIPGIDRAHPLVRGLVLAIPLNEPGPQRAWRPFDRAGRVRAARSGRTRQTGRLGVGAGHAESGGIEWSSRTAFDAPAFTAAVLVEYGSERAAQGRLISRGDCQPWAILETVSAGQGTAVARVSLQPAGSAEVAIPTGTRLRGDLALAVLRIRAAARQLRLDWFDSVTGHRGAETTWPADYTLTPSSTDLVFGDVPHALATAVTAWRGLIHAGWFWNRWLSNPELRQLAQDPFGMFRPNVLGQLVLTAAEQPAPAWHRRRIWGSVAPSAAPATIRPAGSCDIYGWA